MEDIKELYAALLGIRHPWRVVKVDLDLPKNRIDIWVTESKGLRWKCPVCGQSGPLYDHDEERIWRHLHTCQCQTYIAFIPLFQLPHLFNKPYTKDIAK